VLVEYGLFNSLVGLTLVYISIQLPVTVFILEGFFARLPQDLFDAAKLDGYSDFEIFWRITLPIGMPAIATTVILNFISLWNEFLYAVVLITDESKRTLPLGIQKFMGDQLEDIGMIATGLMIAIVPVILIYAFFSERLIQGMTAGAIKGGCDGDRSAGPDLQTLSRRRRACGRRGELHRGGWRVPGPAGAVGLRQVDHFAHDRRARIDHLRHPCDRRSGHERGRGQGP
jgi:hypothetical protein